MLQNNPLSIIVAKGTNPLQRQLADSIVRMVPLDDIRILLATGAKYSEIVPRRIIHAIPYWMRQMRLFHMQPLGPFDLTANEPVTQGLRPLHYAVWQRYAEAANLLLVRGSDVNARDECGYSALHLSAEHGYKELVALLLDQGAHVDYREHTDELFPRTTLCDEPLRLAIRNRHIDIARLLLQHGADPNKRYFFGTEINLISPIDLEYMRLLLMFGADPNSRDRSGVTPLMKAARLSQGIDSVLLLLSYGADVNAMTDLRQDFRSVLHFGVMSGNIDIVNLLLKQGAKINYPAHIRQPTPLDIAVAGGDPYIVKLLIENGANVNASSQIGTALHVVCAERENLIKINILSMLLKAGANPNIVVEGVDGGEQLKPILAEYLSTTRHPNIAIILLFLQFGAKVVFKTQYGNALGILNYLESASRHPEVFETLLDAAESFDRSSIRRNLVLTDQQRRRAIEMASTPLSLQHQSRLLIRAQLADNLHTKVRQLPLPRQVQDYLLYSYTYATSYL